MSNIDEHIKSITTCVWNFVDEIALKKIDKKLLNEHGVSDAAISAIQTPGHVGANVYRKKVFMHLMNSIGYYELLSTGADNIKTLAVEDVNKRLYTPSKWLSFKKKQMANYPLIPGVKDSIDYIDKYLGEGARCSNIATIVPDNSLLKKIEGGYAVSFTLPFDKTRNDNFNQSLEGVPFDIGGNKFEIQEHGCHISKWTRNLIDDDEVSICLSHFNTTSIDVDRKYYQRYITEVHDWYLIERNIAIGLVSLDGIDASGAIITVSGLSYSLYFFEKGGKSYMGVDSNEKVTEKEMRDVVFSICITIGLLTANLYLGEYWMVASEEKTQRKPVGLYYSALTPSIHSDYSIFTTNVYSVLIPSAQKIDSVNGEKRALSIIDNLKLSYAIDAVPIDVFERLISNFCLYEPLQRGIFILLSGTHLPLELQPGAFAIALESIKNISKHVIKDKKEIKLSKKSWKYVRPLLEQVSEKGLSDKKITTQEYEFLNKKLSSLNDEFNADKLPALLEYFHFPLTEFDRGAIKFRNPLLHGDINIKKMQGSDFEKLFSLSLRLHKLCCSIPLLMAGFDGYILNNCKLYGFENTCKSFIKIGGNAQQRAFIQKQQCKIMTNLTKYLDSMLAKIGLRRM